MQTQARVMIIVQIVIIIIIRLSSCMGRGGVLFHAKWSLANRAILLPDV